MQVPRIGSGQPAWQVLDRLRTVGPGWHPLLLRLHEQIVTMDPGYRIDDLKEKLGAVRVRISGDAVHSEIRGLILSAEVQSETICEFCGQPGRRRRRGDAESGWIKAVCDGCHAAWSNHSVMIIDGVVRHRHPRRH